MSAAAELLKPCQLAKKLGVSAGTITNWTQSGAITPVIREGSAIRFDEAAVRQELADRAKAKARKKKGGTK